MKIPTFSGLKIIDESGNCSSEFQQYNDQLNQQMQLMVSNDGYVIPGNTTTDINNFSRNDNANGKPNGTMWYDTTTNQFKGKINGVVKIFTLT